MQPLFESYDPVTTRQTTVEVDAETGLPVFVTVQDVRPIVESAKRLASNFDKHTHPKQELTHVARIPLVMWAELSRLGITRDERALNAWLNTREARQLRTDDGRTL